MSTRNSLTSGTGCQFGSTQGAKVDKLVPAESSAGVPSHNIIQSNIWILRIAAAEAKILSVVENLGVTEEPANFTQQVARLAENARWVEIRQD